MERIAPVNGKLVRQNKFARPAKVLQRRSRIDGSTRAAAKMSGELLTALVINV